MRLLIVVGMLGAVGACTEERWPAAPGMPGSSSGPLDTSGLKAPAVHAGVLAVTGIDFGAVEVGQAAAGTATISNGTGAAVEVGAVMVTGERFEVLDSTCAGALAPGASCEVTVVFEPDAIGRVDGALSIAPDGDVIGASLHGAGGVRVHLGVQGSGAIASDSAMICRDDCTIVIAAPTALQVRPIAGAAFLSWAGACTGDGACVIDPDTAPKDVQAVFTPARV